MKIYKEFMSELIGTMVLMSIGLVTMIKVNLDGESSEAFMTSVVGWGVAATLGMVVAGRGSQGHLNPAITVAMAFSGKFNAKKVWYYILAQFMGAFIATAVTYLFFYVSWMIDDPATEKIYYIFSAPNDVYTLTDRTIGTAFLMFAFMMLINYTPKSSGAILIPILTGFIVVLVGIFFGGIHAYPVNPARELMPRFFCFITGISNSGFISTPMDLIKSFICPFFGAAAGAYVYRKIPGLKDNLNE